MDINNVIKTSTHYVNDSVFSNLFINPVYVSLMITFCIMLIVLCIYTPESKIKTGVYVLVLTTVFVFLHNKVLLIKHRSDITEKESERVISNIEPNLNYLEV